MSRGRAQGPGRLFKRGPTWFLDYTDAYGRRQRQALSTSKKTAERIRTEIIHRRDLARAGLGAEAGLDLTLDELLGDYLADLQTRVTSEHFLNVSQRLRAIVTELSGTRVGELRPMQVVQIRSRAVAEGASHRTGNLFVGRLATMLRWAVRNGLVAKNPIEHLERLPEKAEHRAYRRRALTEDEIRRFLAASERDDEENDVRAAIEGLERVPQTPMWVAFLETGARYGELRQLTWEDVDLSRGLITLRAENTKSRKQRVIPVRPETVARLKRLRAHHESVLGRLPTIADHVFLTPEGCRYRRDSTNPNRILRRVLEAARIPRIDGQGRKLDLHALRHTAGSRMARNGVSLFQAQKVLGHSDPKLTANVYAHAEAEDLRPAIEALPPLAGAPEEDRAREAR